MIARSIVSRSLRTVAVTAFMLGALATCESGPIEPQIPPPSLSPADTVELEFNERSSVIVQPIAGIGQWIVLELDGAGARDSLAVRLLHGGVTLDSTVVDSSTTVARHAVWVPRAFSDSSLVLRLTWLRRSGATTVSTFLLPPAIDPEHVSYQLIVGDTVVEYLDSDADLDRFVVIGEVGSRVSMWAQLDSASQPIVFSFVDRLSPLTDSTLVPLAFVHEFGFPPYEWVTVRAAPGTVGAPGQIEARYRVWLKEINRMPETVAQNAVPGDTIAEAVDEFGDFDRFLIVEPQGQEFRVFLARDSLSNSPLQARLMVNGAAPIPFTLGATDSVLDVKRSPWVQQPGIEAAIVDVFGDESATADRQPVGYRLLYQRRERAPEIAPESLGLVDSVVTETLASCADADDFVITGRPNTDVNVYVGAVLHGAPGCRVRVRLLVGEGELGAADSLRLGTDTDIDRWPPLSIPPSGVVRLRIEGIDAPGQPIGRVQNVGYTLDIYAPDSTPEIAPVTLAVGDSIVTETIDRCTDSDVFDVVGTPGTVVAFTFGFGRATTCGLALSSENNGSGFMLAGANEDSLRFGHVTIPPSGHVPLRVSSDRLGTSADRGAPYFVRSEAVNTAPELGSAVLALGDTAHETISRCGDIDRWQVPMVAGEDVWLRFDRARSSSCRVEVSIGEGSYQGAVVQLYPSDSVGPVTLHYVPIGTGNFEVTVLTLPSGHTDDRDLPYSVVVTGSPNEVAPGTLAAGDASDFVAARQRPASPSVSSTRVPAGSMRTATFSPMPGTSWNGVSNVTPAAASFLQNASRSRTSKLMWSSDRPAVGACATSVLRKLNAIPGTPAAFAFLAVGIAAPKCVTYHARSASVSAA